MTELRYLKNVAALGCNQNKGIGCGICTVVYPPRGFYRRRQENGHECPQSVHGTGACMRS